MQYLHKLFTPVLHRASSYEKRRYAPNICLEPLLGRQIVGQLIDLIVSRFLLVDNETIPDGAFKLISVAIGEKTCDIYVGF